MPVPAGGVGNISSSLETKKGQNGQPDLLLLLLLVVVVMEMVLTHWLTFLSTRTTEKLETLSRHDNKERQTGV